MPLSSIAHVPKSRLKRPAPHSGEIYAAFRSRPSVITTGAGNWMPRSGGVLMFNHAEQPGVGRLVG